MANEYLQRTPTSTGNRRVWTWGGWIKLNSLSTSYTPIMESFTGGSDVYCTIAINSNAITINQDNGAGGVMQITASPLHRDPSSWFHLLVSVDTTQTLAQNRVRIYVNGDEEVVTYSTTPSINFETHFNRTGGHRIGTRWNTSSYINAEYTDIFLVDGQALTPDVFGFNKQGKGYISVGSTQATDFRPGQWVPKTPRVIKTEINRRGGFGVNGFYLPMNDSRNFGADFHGDPNSIITLNEKLPQPRVGVASTASVGLGYTDALRADPYAANLVLAIPGVIGGQSSGYGDYSANIKGSGVNKTVTVNGSALRFNGSSDYFTVPASSDFNFGTGDFTAEFWLWANSSNTSAYRRWLTTTSAGFSAGTWVVRENAGGSDKAIGVSGGTIGPANSFQRGQWNHIAYVRYNTNESVYVNGVAVGIVTNSTTNYTEGATNGLYVGGYYSTGPAEYFDGYMQDLRIYKGVAKYTGGFDVPRPYTPVGIATWRQVPDTTANNFATMNPLIEARPSSGTNSPSNSTIVTFAGGNLDLTNSASAGNAQRMYSFATIGISTGRWYWEVRAGTNARVGLSKGFQQLNYVGTLGNGAGLEAMVFYGADGGISIANTSFYSTATTLTAPTYDTTNIIGVAINSNSGLNNLTVQWFKDGVGVATLTGVGATSPVLEWFPTKAMNSSSSGDDQKFNFGQNPTFSGNVSAAGTFTDTNGKGLFKYQPPSGFLALCEDNLPTPAISDPGKYFKTVLYAGTSASRNVVGVGFTPDLVWVKERNGADNHRLVDSVRGPIRELYSSLTNAEAIDSGGVLSFDSDGFSLGNGNSYNESGINHVAWCWRAGAGTTSTNTNGSITSVVSVNQDAGFSIVSYTGNGSNPTTVGHGLGKAPKFIIFKRRNSAVNWFVYHGFNSSGAFEGLNTTNAYNGALALFNQTAPTSSVINLGNTDSNASGGTYIAYCWAEIEGYSKFGSYTGNGSTDGPFVYCGFKPAWVMIKRTDSTQNWCIVDNARSPINVGGQSIFANTSDTEYTDTSLRETDFLSNGIKFRCTGTERNASGGTYIFAAYAESPFTTANAK